MCLVILALQTSWWCYEYVVVESFPGAIGVSHNGWLLVLSAVENIVYGKRLNYMHDLSRLLKVIAIAKRRGVVFSRVLSEGQLRRSKCLGGVCSCVRLFCFVLCFLLFFVEEERLGDCCSNPTCRLLSIPPPL